MTLAEKIKRLRTEKCLTQERLAQAAGLTVSSVSTIEAGRRTPTLASLQAIARALGTTAGELLDGSERAE